MCDNIQVVEQWFCLVKLDPTTGRVGVQRFLIAKARGRSRRAG
jgi:hypothetical protein